MRAPVCCAGWACGRRVYYKLLCARQCKVTYLIRLVCVLVRMSFWLRVARFVLSNHVCAADTNQQDSPKYTIMYLCTYMSYTTIKLVVFVVGYVAIYRDYYQWFFF